MKKRTAIKVKLIKSFLMLLFSFSCLICVTFSWFTVNSSVSLGFLGLHVSSNDISHTSCEIYRGDGKRYDAKNNIYYDKNNNIIRDDIFCMPEYDRIITEKNIKTELILKINAQVNVSSGSFLTTVSSLFSEDYFFPETNNKYRLSDIIELSFLVDDENENLTGNQEVYDYWYDKFMQNSAGFSSFRNQDNFLKTEDRNNPGKTSIEYESNLESQNMKTIILMIRYNDVLIKNLFTRLNFSFTSLTQDNQIHFFSDLAITLGVDKQ